MQCHFVEDGYNHANSSLAVQVFQASYHKHEIDISCPIFVSTLKCTSSPSYTSLIGHSKMELTDVDFSFQKFPWLF